MKGDRGEGTHRSQKSLELFVLVKPGGQLAPPHVPSLFHLRLDLPQPLDLLVQHRQLALLGRQVEFQVDGSLCVWQIWHR